MTTQKTALITGGSRGIGAVVAQILGVHGYYIYLNCRKINDHASQALDNIRSAGGEGEIIEFDVTDEIGIQVAVENAKLKTIDLLFNNAGILFDNLLCDLEPNQWEQVINTNFWGGVHVYNCIYNQLSRSPKPVIINMGSISGVRPRKGQGAYSVSKAMIIEWTNQIIIHDPIKKINAFCISPGPVETDMIISTPWYADPNSKKRIPLSRYAKPLEIAEFVLFLGENPTMFKNGFNFVMDGGLTQTIKDF